MLVHLHPLGMMRPQEGDDLVGRSAGRGVLEGFVDLPPEFAAAVFQIGSPVPQESEASQNHLGRTLRRHAEGPAIRFMRDDVVVYPIAGPSLVIAQPRFLARWLRIGTVPDAAFIRNDEADLMPRDDRPAWMD